MKKTLFTLFALFIIHAAPLAAQGMNINGGNVVLGITTGLPGLQPLSVTNTATRLTFKRQADITKVTVATSCPGQDFTLTVLATSVTAGTAAPEVTLTNGMLAVDFIRDIPVRPPVNETCTLRYTASATFAQGNSVELGDDVHTVTYTIITQ